MHAPAANPVPSDIFVRVLGQERLRYARQLNRYRCAGVTLFLVLELVVDPPWKRPANLWHVGFLVLYFGLSLSVLLAGKRSDRVARWSARVVPFVDMPMVFLIQFSDFGQTTNPRALADFTLGVFVCLVMLAALSLEGWQIATATVVAAALQLGLQFRAADTMIGQVGGVMVLSVAGAICWYASRSRIELVQVLCGEQLRRERLGRYFSPQVAERIERELDELGTGQVCEVTVLFSDLRDFTALSEQMQASAVVALLNEINSRMVDIVFAHGGTLDKYIGDGLMVYFGAPVPQADHAERALRCALAMQAELAPLNERRLARSLPSIRMGIGIHTGPAVIGSIGAPHRREFTAIGDTVNLASRLEQLTKEFDEGIVVSEATRRLVSSQFVFHNLASALVKGRSAPVQTFAPRGEG